MLGRSRPFEDEQLGHFKRSRGAWRGKVVLEPHGPIPLSLPGGRSGPDEAAVALARSIQAEYDQGLPAIESALDEHRGAAVEAGTEAGHSVPAPLSVAIIQLDGLPTIQLAYQVEWDDEHTLGACLRNGELVELNGSILEP